MMPHFLTSVPTSRNTEGKGLNGWIFISSYLVGQSHIAHPSASGPLHFVQSLQFLQSPRQVAQEPSVSQWQPGLVQPVQFSQPTQSSLLHSFVQFVHFSSSCFTQLHPSHFYSHTHSSQSPQSPLHFFPFSIQVLNFLFLVPCVLPILLCLYYSLFLSFLCYRVISTESPESEYVSSTESSFSSM